MKCMNINELKLIVLIIPSFIPFIGNKNLSNKIHASYDFDIIRFIVRCHGFVAVFGELL